MKSYLFFVGVLIIGFSELSCGFPTTENPHENQKNCTSEYDHECSKTPGPPTTENPHENQKNCTSEYDHECSKCPGPPTTEVPSDCPIFCTYEYNPVCGMTRHRYGWKRKIFGNKCSMFATNYCEGGNYIPCDGRAQGYEQYIPYC
nr:uncharacterized protein LOC106681997 isoform X1 [Halyomorpha halys]